MSEETKAVLAGAFELTEEVLYLNLPDRRRFSIVIRSGRVHVTDISWVDYHMKQKSGSGKRTLTADAILSTEPSDLEVDKNLLRKLYLFMDTAGVPPKE